MSATRALVIAPHPDDEVLGCGGTMARLAAQGVDVTVLAVCSDVPPLYAADVKDAIKAEARRAHAILGASASEFLDFASVEVSRMSVAELNGGVQRIVDAVEPNLVFAPFPDRHRDHRVVFDAAMVATRPIGSGRGIRMVALYETISETFWNVPGAEPSFVPHWTVDITSTVQEKLDAFEQFQSQRQEYPGPRSLRALESLALFRGSQSSMEFGEAFQIARMTSPDHALWAL